MVVEPFSFAQDPFLCETEPLGNGAAFCVAGGAMQNHTVAVLVGEREVGQAGGGFGHDAAALMRRAEPVADLGPAIQWIDIVLADDTGENALADDSKRESIVIFG